MEGTQTSELYREATSRGAFCCRCKTAWQGSLGLEPTFGLYVQHLVEVFQEVRRVLRDDGTCWLNLGDSYYNGDKGGYTKGRVKAMDSLQGSNLGADFIGAPNRMPQAGLKPKDLVGIPWRVASALQADGWYFRAILPWIKANPMPESVNGWRWERHRVKIGSRPAGAPSGWNTGHDRPDIAGRFPGNDQQPEWTECPGCKKCTETNGLVLRRGSGRPILSHEYVFLLTKSETYFYDAETVRRQGTSGLSDVKKMVEGRDRIGGKHKGLDDPLNKASRATNIGRQRGVGDPMRHWRTSDFWWDSAGALLSGPEGPIALTVNTQPFAGTHFATFPEKLVIPLIQASTSERGACAGCRAPWARIVEHNRTVGWRPTCLCKITETVSCTVLDPFVGSGTVVMVAQQLGRAGIGVDLKAEYLEMARHRCAQTAMVLLP